MDLRHRLTVGDVAREHRRSRPVGTAVVDGDVRLTWPAFDDRTNRLAAALLAEGVEAGDRLLWLGQNSFRVLELLVGAAKTGAVLCPANWRQSANELAFVLDDLDPRLVVWQQERIGEAVAEARARAGDGRARWLRHDTDEGDPDGYEAFLADDDSDAEVPVDPASPVLLLYTAAFTGRPSGALLSHTALLVQGLVTALLQEISDRYVYLNSGPLFHAATLMTTLSTYEVGGTNVFTPRADAEQLCRLIEQEGCTGAFLMPPTIKKMIEVNADRRYDLSSLRTFAGSPEWNDMITVDTSPVARNPAGFGQTEVMGMLMVNAWGGDVVGNAGRPIPTAQVRIVDPDGEEVHTGETGEIVARGPTVMVGYHARAELTAARSAGGWHHTGDLGRREVDGSITFIGPKGRLIKSAAENIYPVEVERCLQQHPAVREAAVIGVPDRTWGQRVKAVVVLEDGAAASADELVEHCRRAIAGYKKPSEVVFVTELPRQGWQVDYDALDDAHGGGGYPGTS
ncbi:MAG: AMP-binding protein [Acidimicrobiales bacterium]